MDKKYNSILLIDGYDSGETHWQIYEDCSLMFSIGYISQDEKRIMKRNDHIYYTKPVLTADSLDRWHHLPVTYNNDSGTVMKYFDGEEVGRHCGDHEQYGLFFLEGGAEHVDGKHGRSLGITINAVAPTYLMKPGTRPFLEQPGISSIRVKSHSRGSH